MKLKVYVVVLQSVNKDSPINILDHKVFTKLEDARKCLATALEEDVHEHGIDLADADNDGICNGNEDEFCLLDEVCGDPCYAGGIYEDEIEI